MLFSSIPFLFYFLPAVVVLYFLTPRKLKNAFLLLVSLMFYAWGEPRYVFLMAAAIGLFFIYGIAVAFCGLALYPVFLRFRERFPKRWQAYLASFLVNTLFCVVAELILGFLFNADYSAWDYRDQFMNFMGQICLLYTLAFGVMSSFITWIVYPMMERHISNLNRDVFRIVFVVSCVLFLLIIATYNVDLDTLMPGENLSIDLSSSSSTS